MPSNKTTPTPPSLEERFAAMEAANTEAAEVNRLTLANASVSLTASADAIEEAEEHVSDIEAALVRATGEYTAADLVAAKGELEAAELAHRGTQARIDRARVLRVTTQTDAALALVPLIHCALPGVPVVVTAATDLPELTAADAPLVVLAQLDANVHTDGSLMAEVTRRDHYTGGIKRTARPVEVRATYLRTSIHRDIDIARWERERVALGLRKVDLPNGGTGIPRELAPGLLADSFVIKTGEPAPVPAVIQPTDDFGTLAQLVGNAAADTLPRPWVHDSSSTTDSSSTEVDGIRTITVTGTTKLREVSRPGPGADAKPAKLTDLIGTMVYGVGSVTDVQAERVAVDRFTWSVELVSRTSHDVPHPADTDTEDEAEAA